MVSQIARFGVQWSESAVVWRGIETAPRRAGAAWEDDVNLIEALLAQQVVTEAQIAECLRITDCSLGEALVVRGFVTEDRLAAMYAGAGGFDLVHPLEHAAPGAVLARVPEEVARACRMLPLAQEGPELVVAMADPSDTVALQALDELGVICIRRLVAPISELCAAIDQFYGGRRLADPASQRMIERLNLSWTPPPSPPVRDQRRSAPAGRGRRRTLGEVLVRCGLATVEQVRDCMCLSRATGQDYWMLLSAKGFVSERDLAATMAEHLGLPLVRPLKLEIAGQTLGRVPGALAHRRCVLPIAPQDDALQLAMANPLDIQAMDEVRLAAHSKIEPVVAVASELIAAIAKHYGAPAETKPGGAAGRVGKPRLSELLMRHGGVAPEAFAECVEERDRTGRNLLEVLIERGHLDPDELSAAPELPLGAPKLDVEQLQAPPEVLLQVPRAFARRYRALPVAIRGKVLTLAMADPFDVRAIEAVKHLTGLVINPVHADAGPLKEAIDRNYGALDDSGGPAVQ